jgi:DNA-directed RNA polymerase subunit alpha
MLIIQRPTIEAIGDEQNNRQSFSVGPLDPGFGHTLGNSLRRTLLSSIPGAAATKVQFEAPTLHEFDVIEGVKEDVQDITLNLKDLLLKVESDEPVRLHLEKTGEGAVTAADLSTTADVTILNPTLHLAYLTTKTSKLSFELTVERGKGYVGAEGNKGSSTIGVIPLDAIFSPVRRVTFEIEPVRVEQSKDFDKLILDIETDGSLSPSEALASAGKTLSSLVGLIASFDEAAPALELGDVGTAVAAATELDNITIEQLGLAERSRNCLKRAGINTLAQLINCTERDLTSITNFGATSLKDVEECLEERGLSLKAEG